MRQKQRAPKTTFVSTDEEYIKEIEDFVSDDRRLTVKELVLRLKHSKTLNFF